MNQVIEELMEYEDYLEQYSNMVTRICLVHTGNFHDAQDCYQNVFFALYKQLKKEKPRNVKAWLVTVSINECKRCMRFRLGISSLQLDELVLPTFNDNDTEMIKLIMELPAKHRDAVYLHYYEGYSVAEIASIMDAREGTIKSYLKRGRDKLRKFLTQD
ncbi:MAG: RNA polymerase sigma factor [Oscillospiraceae bacterium]|nr:RNA polymerase sigma factor [Oscillospiraceae bacterium]